MRAWEASLHGFGGRRTPSPKRNRKALLSCINPESHACGSEAATFLLISIPASDLLCHLGQII